MCRQSRSRGLASTIRRADVSFALLAPFCEVRRPTSLHIDKALTTPIEGSNVMVEEPTADDNRDFPSGQVKRPRPDDDNRQGTLLEYLT